MSGAQELVLGSTLDEVAGARRFARSHLLEHDQELRDDAALVVTELVTNALLHGTAPVVLRVERMDGGVRFAVHDTNPRLPVRPRPSTDGLTGRGLALVAALATGWGIEPDESGKTVWAELGPHRSEPVEAAAPVDPTAVLQAWADDPALYTVRLGAVPTDLLLAAKKHIDDVVRELTLARSASPGARLPKSLITSVTETFASAREDIKRQALAAAERGDPQTELVLHQPESAAAAGEQYLSALEEADHYARAARLLTLEAPPAHRAFRRWYVQALVDQIRALSLGLPAPTPPSLVETLRQAARTGLPNTGWSPLNHAGALAPAYQQVHWGATPLGDPETWSPTLRSAVELVLQTRFPVTLMWGSEFVLVYNEAYAELIADKHPLALGRPCREVFPEAWDVIGPMLQGVRVDGRAVMEEDIHLPLLRHDRMDEAYFTFCYSAVRSGEGDIEGVIDIATETTAPIITARRLAVLSRLNGELADAPGPTALLERAVRVLADDPHDLPGLELRFDGLTRTAGARVPHGVVPDDWMRQGVALEEAGDRVVARLSLHEPGTAPTPASGVLTVLLSEGLAPDRGYLDFLRLVAGAVAQGLVRLRVREAERAARRSERQLSEALQLSLLTRPVQPDHLRVGVRYQAASDSAQIGGDWYDAFLLPDGHLMLVVGDVSGHDQQAATGMAQVRNLLRGIAYGAPTPAATLLGLDRALDGLAVDAIATAVVCRVEQRADGQRVLRWSNAGHPPPVLIDPDGRARLLDTEPELLLGMDPGEQRVDHAVALPEGSTLVLYTDGLVERRGTSLQESLDRLRDHLGATRPGSAEEVCTDLLEVFGAGADDDIALLVLRAGPLA